ncbi:uncharacterized protein DUF1707 [Kribbella voronezhensis]|uniref:Uncharacterized protein DUF1707 n=1 Tax=Kribbella voronezhensis TaxID=2512212 RepID=A0A4R7THV3_9ACTN|nr:DUF1707 domain-containing protein [Kribbella voronezhensis]TDU91911.1 uncharacterized protein DUF1707 [Kribbella voronezhensis]
MNTLLDTLGPLLSPDDVRLTGDDKRTAVGKLDAAARQGTLHVAQSIDRHDLLDAARTRGDLRQVFDGLPDALPSKGLTRALQIVSAAWLTVCVVQFVIWLVLLGFGHFHWPWWLWSDLGLAVPVAILWWTHESYHRKSQLVATR